MRNSREWPKRFKANGNCVPKSFSTQQKIDTLRNL